VRADLGRKALEGRVAPFREQLFTRPPKGWLRAIRDALGMTTAQYAGRLGVSQPRISALEKSEMDETVTLATLRRAAEALDCRLVYMIVPNRPLDDMLRDRAIRRADEQLARVDHTMRLENQGLTARDLELERARIIDELLRGDTRRLWDAP
jgi:predicted DNA-binding mobile mystery protein A